MDRGKAKKRVYRHKTDLDKVEREGIMGKDKGPTKAKSKKILREGEVHGKALTKKQKGFFGARAGGAKRKT